MHFRYRGRRILSVEPGESQGEAAAGLEDQEISCPDRLDADERYLSDGITRAEIMEYLSQTYGLVFMAELGKHLS
jgi:hypothetical protein